MQAAHFAYRRVQTETASPGQLIAMLYDALLRNLGKVESGLEARDLEAAHEPLMRAQDIVLELISSLDMEADGDAGALARQLAPLYEYLYHRLLDASLNKDVDAVREVSGLVSPMRDAWWTALEQISQHTASAPTGGEVRRGE